MKPIPEQKFTEIQDNSKEIYDIEIESVLQDRQMGRRILFNNVRYDMPSSERSYRNRVFLNVAPCSLVAIYTVLIHDVTFDKK